MTWLSADLTAAWTVGEHLLAATIDALVVANWQRTKDGSKGQKRPKPMPRPGDAAGAARDPDRLDRQVAAFRARQAERARVKEG